MPKIERLPSGAYRVRLSIGKGSDGKYHYKTFTAKDKPTLRRKIAQYEDEPKDQAPQLLDAIAEYIDAREAVLSPYTIKGYRNIERALKAIPCAAVRCDAGAPAFQRIVNTIAHKSPKTVRNYIGLISSAVKFMGYAFPPVTLPQREKKDVFIPDEQTIRQILDAIDGTDLEIPVKLGLLGLRRGEVCALEIEDLHQNVIHITKAAVDIGGAVTTKLPKTYESTRFIRIPTDLARKIRKQGYVTEMTPDYLSHRFTIMLRKNGIPHFRFHDLRHFFVSYCHNVLRLSDAQIQKLGGWKTDRIMKQHYLQSMRDVEALQTVADGFGDFMT